MSNTSIKTVVAAFYKKEVQDNTVVEIVKKGSIDARNRSLPTVADRDKENREYSFSVHDKWLG